MEGVDGIVAERLRLLAEYRDELDSYRTKAHNFAAYTDTPMLRRAVERTLQVAVEICLDIGRRLIAQEGFRYAVDGQDVFRVLAEEAVVSSELLSSLTEMARFRNLIVHDYAKIDDAIVYSILMRRLGDFDAFAEAVRVYLQA